MFDSLVNPFTVFPKEAWAILGMMAFAAILSLKDWGISEAHHRRDR